MNGENQNERQVWRLFLQAQSRILAELAVEMETATGLPLSWYDVLAHLQSSPGKQLRLQELVRSLVISKSGLSRRIDRMEEAGLVIRQECPQDKRGAFAMLTPKGEQLLETAKPVHLAGIQEHFLQFLSDKETEVIVSAFRKIVAAAEPRHEVDWIGNSAIE